ncbi:MAG: lipoyl(octanoyl) transferase LipB [Desulfohalobiaceae bacterium]
MNIVRLGRVPYSQALRLQEDAAAKVASGGESALFLLEHFPVITFGRHGGEEFLCLSEEALKSKGVQLIKTSRGGSVTCHFPGQMVAYPIVRLDRRRGGVRQFVRDLEQAVIGTLASFSVPGARRAGYPGVWTAGRKIASVGIGVRHWITRHGVALNVGADLEPFSWITLCGLPGAEPTSLHRELGSPQVSMDMVQDAFERQITAIFPDT